MRKLKIWTHPRSLKIIFFFSRFQDQVCKLQKRLIFIINVSHPARPPCCSIICRIFLIWMWHSPITSSEIMMTFSLRKRNLRKIVGHMQGDKFSWLISADWLCEWKYFSSETFLTSCRPTEPSDVAGDDDWSFGCEQGNFNEIVRLTFSSRNFLYLFCLQRLDEILVLLF